MCNSLSPRTETAQASKTPGKHIRTLAVVVVNDESYKQRARSVIHSFTAQLILTQAATKFLESWTPPDGQQRTSYPGAKKGTLHCNLEAPCRA